MTVVVVASGVNITSPVEVGDWVLMASPSNSYVPNGSYGSLAQGAGSMFSASDLVFYRFRVRAGDPGTFTAPSNGAGWVCAVVRPEGQGEASMANPVPTGPVALFKGYAWDPSWVAEGGVAVEHTAPSGLVLAINHAIPETQPGVRGYVDFPNWTVLDPCAPLQQEFRVVNPLGDRWRSETRSS